MENNDNPFALRLITRHHDFLRPYIEAEMPLARLVGPEQEADYIVEIADPVYEPRPDASPGHVLLMCPNVVGTGMELFPRRLAVKIGRGRFIHGTDSETPVATVHAVDVARAVRLTLGRKGIFYVTDTRTHTLGDLAEALACRMGNLRLLHHRMPLIDRIVGSGVRRDLRLQQWYDGAAFATEFGFNPVSVTEYLRTHVYDESSL